MNNDHSDDFDDSEDGPERIFRVLKDRPTPELDSEALWRRIEGDLEPHPVSWFDRVAAMIGLDTAQPVGIRLAAAGAVAILMAAVVWLAPGMMEQGLTQQSAPDTAAQGDSAGTAAHVPVADNAQLVPLTGATDTPMVASEAVPQQEWMLDVRLVRGYSGAIPADAMTTAGAGAGGADRLADLRSALDGLMPFGEFALVGQWQGKIDAATGATLARLSDSFELSFAAEYGEAGVNLADVLLDGAGRPLVASELVLAPGRPYLFGVQAEGEAADTGLLVLAVRLLPTAEIVPEPR